MGVIISRILHAGYLIEVGTTQILFDPIFENPFSGNCYAFPSVEFDVDEIRQLKLSAIFISHFHDDHCSLESLNLLDRRTPIFIYCMFDEIIQLIVSLGFTQVFPLKINQPIRVGEVEVIPRRALDADVDSLFQIKARGLNILNVVDSWIDYTTLNLLQEQRPWDLILWPFQTMRELEVLNPSRAEASQRNLPEEWLEQLKLLNPRFVVPSSCQFIHESWSWYNKFYFPISYQIFTNTINEILPTAKVLRMDPGTSRLLQRVPRQFSEQHLQRLPSEVPSDHSLSLVSDDVLLAEAPALKWIQRRSSEVVDYEYEPSSKIPTTSEIAKNFPGLSEEQQKRVEGFCTREILKLYPNLDLLEGYSYFSEPRYWQLSIFDHFGQVKRYYYHLDLNSDFKIKLVNEMEPENCSWTTEVIAFKLFGALERGESLTSLYLRVNDHTFSSEIEAELAQVEVGEDPLIRCLFFGRIGGYQRAQLERIQSRNVSLK